MVEAGLPRDRVFVKPHFYPGHPVPLAWQDRQDYAVYAGRLSGEKGIETMLRAWLAMKEGPELHVLGDGPLRGVVLELLRTRPDVPVRFHGHVPPAEAEKEIAQAKLLLVPSECFEGFPMVIREAFAFGTPVAVSNIGPLPEIVKDGVNGIVFDSGNADSLRRQVQRACQAPGLLERLSVGARKTFEQSYTEEVNYRALMSIYERAIATQRTRSTGE